MATAGEIEEIDSASARSHDAPFDVLIIGAGMHGLAVLSRLRDPPWHCASWAHAGTNEAQPWSVCVVDEHGRWLSQWRRHFSRLGISHLRSTMVLHPDTEDEYGLYRFSRAMGRGHEAATDIDLRLPRGRYPMHDDLLDLLAIRNTDYFRRPSSALFDDFCDRVVDGLPPHTLLAATCEDVIYIEGEAPTAEVQHKIFEARIRAQACGGKRGKLTKIFARSVCFCVGAPIPSVPAAFEGVASARVKHASRDWVRPRTVEQPSRSDSQSKSRCDPVGNDSASSTGSTTCCDSANHRFAASSNIADPAIAPSHDAAFQSNLSTPELSIEMTCTAAVAKQLDIVVVVGGGLTSAQTALALCAAGGHHVFLLTRRDEWSIRDFDVPILWVDRWTQEYGQLRRSWAQQAAHERLASVKSVRGGGSMTPEAFERLMAEQRAGRLTLLCRAEVVSVSAVGGTPEHRSGDDRLALEVMVRGRGEPLRLAPVVEVVLATGTRLAVEELPCFQGLRSRWPIEEHGGAPSVQACLRWVPGIDAFVLGGYALLQLGPDAVNLAGARRGSRVVARELRAMRLARLRASVLASEGGSGCEPMASSPARTEGPAQMVAANLPEPSRTTVDHEGTPPPDVGELPLWAQEAFDI